MVAQSDASYMSLSYSIVLELYAPYFKSETSLKVRLLSFLKIANCVLHPPHLILILLSP